MSTPERGADTPTVTYYLVLLLPGRNHIAAAEHTAAHVAFIDEMTAANVVLLGGPFEPSIEGAEAAYLLRTAAASDAAGWAARDPFVTNGVYVARIVAWHLVGISLGAIDPALT